jgi:hypothetical protein
MTMATTNTHATPEAWIGSLWMRGYGNGLVLLHDPREPTAHEMRAAGLSPDNAGNYVSGCIHGTGYRGIYNRGGIAEEVRA